MTRGGPRTERSAGLLALVWCRAPEGCVGQRVPGPTGMVRVLRATR